MAKIYGIDGYSTASYIFGIGKAQKFRAEFTGGRPDLDGKHPATYIARSVGQEIAIEHSQLFRDGQIYLYRDTAKAAAPARTNVIRMGADALPTPAPVIDPVVEEPAVSAGGDIEEHPEVTTREEAVALLKAKGAKASVLRSAEAIQRAAATFGVTFPNWNA